MTECRDHLDWKLIESLTATVFFRLTGKSITGRHISLNVGRGGSGSQLTALDNIVFSSQHCSLFMTNSSRCVVNVAAQLKA